ncbi:hypothetical protein DFH08DRAFT_813991 [Mycena albidolilacea]|uniref:Uncharacterized protein n=1 Tax=Mycena albidolilacea TaxID=1033008 RepID=A0AAD6ZSJ7_9AGAR|nr:hypothetical protein DFH08DRAFT_813991 [Mycena albidolilacea]
MDKSPAVYDILCNEEAWQWDTFDRHNLVFHRDGTGEASIEFTLTKRRPRPIDPQRLLNEDLLLNDAFALRILNITVEHGCFPAPRDCGTRTSTWYQSQLLFDVSPYPAWEAWWAESRNMVDSVGQPNMRQFCARQLAKEDQGGLCLLARVQPLSVHNDEQELLPPVLEMEMWLCQIFKDLRDAPSCFKDPSGTVPKAPGGQNNILSPIVALVSVQLNTLIGLIRTVGDFTIVQTLLPSPLSSLGYTTSTGSEPNCRTLHVSDTTTEESTYGRHYGRPPLFKDTKNAS